MHAAAAYKPAWDLVSSNNYATDNHRSEPHSVEDKSNWDVWMRNLTHPLLADVHDLRLVSMYVDTQSTIELTSWGIDCSTHRTASRPPNPNRATTLPQFTPSVKISSTIVLNVWYAVSVVMCSWLIMLSKAWLNRLSNSSPRALIARWISLGVTSLWPFCQEKPWLSKQ